MKTFRYILLVLIVFSLSYCSKDIVEPVEEINNPEISVSVSYVSKIYSRDTIPDVGAKLYIFHDLHINDINIFEYKGDGLFMGNTDSKTTFSELRLIPQNGETSIILDEKMENVVIAIESNYYKNDRRMILIHEVRLNKYKEKRIHKVFFLP